MKYNSKNFRKNNYFVLYDKNDELICYFDNFDDLAKYINYRISDLVHEYNRHNTNIINIIIDNKIFQLATFC